MVRKKSLSDLRVMQRPVRNNPQPSLLASPEAKDEDDFEDDDFDDEEDEESEDEEESVDEGESDKSEEPPVKEKAKRGGKVATTEKMLLKLRMSSTRQQPVWADAKVTLSERGFERSAELAREVEAAITKFRRVLDAEAKLKAAEDARRELDGIIAS